MENASKFLALLKRKVLLIPKLLCCCYVNVVVSPSVALEGLQLFDEEVCQTFSDGMCIDPSDLFWQQAQLS